MKIQGVVCAVSLSLVALLGGCASLPGGPSVMALPGTGKNFNEFRASDLQCRAYASQLIGVTSDDPAVRNALVGTAVGAAAGAAIGGQQGAGIGAGAGVLVGSVAGADASRIYGREGQRRYDVAYIQCMYASGHKVPVPAALAKSLQQKQPLVSTPEAAPGVNLLPMPVTNYAPRSPSSIWKPPAPSLRRALQKNINARCRSFNRKTS